ncbi:hypothetical protein [Vibrio jasicida]|uniref:hypothetical protein n=1 Tax=Vibrio jasicida TaxID=766224 RepID=UPI0040693F42
MPQIDYTDRDKKLKKFISRRELSFIDNSDPVSIAIPYMFLYVHSLKENGDIIPRFGLTRITDKFELGYFVDFIEAYRNQDMLEVFFDYNENSDIDSGIKRKINDEIAKIYEKYKSENKLYWIEKGNREQALWLKKYISNNELIEKITREIPKCLNKEELIHITVPSLIYSMDMEDAERELFIIKMRQAWGQVKYRNKIKKENKVNFNFVTDKRTKEKLKKISRVYDLTMNETLDRLINAAYQSSSKKHES